jgi:hypothetical protein
LPLTTTDEHVIVVVVLSSSLLPGIKFKVSLPAVAFVSFYSICEMFCNSFPQALDNTIFQRFGLSGHDFTIYGLPDFYFCFNNTQFAGKRSQEN